MNTRVRIWTTVAALLAATAVLPASQAWAHRVGRFGFETMNLPTMCQNAPAAQQAECRACLAMTPFNHYHPGLPPEQRCHRYNAVPPTGASDSSQ